MKPLFLKLLGIFTLICSVVSTDVYAANADKTVFITGSNRGIGYGLAQHYAEQGYQVIATARSPESASQLQELADTHKSIVIEQLDVTDHVRIDELADKYKDQSIDILINNAGVRPTSSEADIDADRARLMFEVNALAPIKIAKAFLPHVEKSEEKKIVNISTQVASLSAPVPPAPVLWDYRMSKAALNSYMVTLSLETAKKGVIVTMMHPGAVNTQWEAQDNEAAPAQQGGGNQRILIKDSTDNLTDMIGKLTIEDNGSFYNSMNKAAIAF